ncbi:MAG TPA: hypothetical protein VLI39_01650 [Sedimentisphaerales bacterium]|nr:hypothetical protein [Sedimentisphaerales bacterium]
MSNSIRGNTRRDDGNYEDTQYYFPEDLARLILCAQKAFEYTTLKERKDVDESVPA